MAEPPARDHVVSERSNHAKGESPEAAPMPTIPEEICGQDNSLPTRHANRHPRDAWAAWIKRNPIKQVVSDNGVRLAAPAAASSDQDAVTSPSPDSAYLEESGSSALASECSTSARVDGPRSSTGKAGFEAVLEQLCSEDEADLEHNGQNYKKRHVQFAAPAILVHDLADRQTGAGAVVGEVDTARTAISRLL